MSEHRHEHGHEHQHNDGHEHEHDRQPDADVDVGKLRVLLPHLVEHNRDHVTDVSRWAHVAREAGLDAVADELDKAVDLSRRIGECFEAAVKKLG